MPIRPSVPSGASRMIHHSAFWTTASTERLSARKPSAASPTDSAAAPASAAMNTTCSTLPSLNAVTGSVGTMPVRKSVQPPVVSGAAAAPRSRLTPTPGSVIRPSTIARVTAISDVAMNHSSVRTASRAAFVSPRRFAMLTTTAVNTSGGTASLSSCTNRSPISASVSASQRDLALARHVAECHAECETGQDLRAEADARGTDGAHRVPPEPRRGFPVRTNTTKSTDFVHYRRCG